MGKLIFVSNDTHDKLWRIKYKNKVKTYNDVIADLLKKKKVEK